VSRAGLRRCVDSSVVVAGFATWHERHLDALEVLAAEPDVPAHVLVESYSVLTRLPAPHRAPAPVVAEFLRRRFPRDPLTVSGPEYLTLISQLAANGLGGGATYDALIARVAVEHGCTLVTLDARATATYAAVGCPYDRI
jgi:predicted nucleic acid-binding protein